MTFEEILDHAIAKLQRRGRLTYSTLKRQFQLDDEALKDLKDELLYAHPEVRDDAGRGLIWASDTGTAPLAATAPTGTREQAPLAYTPAYLAEKILTSKSALEGERKQVTVLLADLKDSTELIRGLDPEAAEQLLDPAIHCMMDAVRRFEGTVNQVLGDGIMALFGAPIAHEDHALRACHVALAMQAAMRTTTEEVRRTRGLELRMHVGLNSGEVVVRAIGNDLHMDYSAVGETTHLALLDALPDDSPLRRLDPAQRRQRTLDGLKRVLLRESQVQPLLLVCEDLHWIDSETQALLDSLVESLPTARLLLLVNYRPEYQHGWGSKTYYTQLRLDPLPPVSADEFLQALLGNDPSLAPDRVAEQVERLAQHALRGEVWDKAVPYCPQAGARARDRAAFREAVASFEQALQALAHLPKSGDTQVLGLDLRLALEAALNVLGEHRRRLALLGEAESLARALDDRSRLGRVLAQRSYALRNTGDHDGAIAVGQQALALAAALGDRALQVEASYRLGHVYYDLGDFGRAADLLRQNVETADLVSAGPC